MKIGGVLRVTLLTRKRNRRQTLRLSFLVWHTPGDYAVWLKNKDYTRRERIDAIS